MKYRPVFCAAAALLLPGLAAASPDTKQSPVVDVEKVRSAASDAIKDTRDGLGEAAMTPLEDLNLKRKETPPALAGIEDPFTPVGDADCATILGEIGRLNGALGTTASPLADKEDRALSERAAAEASKAVLGTIASHARDLIPYRNVVRKVSGADDHAKARRQAFERGAKRRAYLLGIENAMGCRTGTALQVTAETDVPAPSADHALSVQPIVVDERPLPPAAAPGQPEYLPAPTGPDLSLSDQTESTPTSPTGLRAVPETSRPQWPPEG